MMRWRFRKDSDAGQNLHNMFVTHTAGLVTCVLFLFLALAGSWYAAVSELTLPHQLGEGNLQKGTAGQVKLSAKTSILQKDARSISTKDSAARKAFMASLSAALEAEGVKSRAYPNNGLLRISVQNVVFPLGRADLQAESMQSFDRVGAVLEKALSCLKPRSTPVYKAPSAMAPFQGIACSAASEMAFECSPAFQDLRLAAVQLEGHADARQLSGGHFKDNLELSSARAETLLRRLQSCQPGLFNVGNGVGNPLLNVAAHSTQQPADKANPMSDANRRIELRFLLEGE
jgi:flagellar motor protein MotB